MPKTSKLFVLHVFEENVFSLNKLKQKHEINLSFLLSGIHCLKIENNQEQKVLKIVKE